ncbi:hypothetical protein ZIOFF_031020 [Zingiber officinale]|uniref:Uncharacterized protein n=1 Tax=Zingiber officinale TaxID=94328 RepID=A0A8J5GYW0_ZINOF|nr:hypothetical protein ZIOFF_031020 [Zingiber officinale]
MLKREFEGCMMEKTETIEAYFSHLMEIKNEMELNGYEVEDEMYVEKVLNNLLLKFDYIVVVLQEKMSTEELHGSLILHESRIHERPENSTKKDSTEKVLQALTPKSNEQGQSNNGGGDSHARGRNFRARGRGGYGNYQGCGRGIGRVRRNNLMMLKREFEGCMMEKTETIEAYFSHLMEIKNEMELNGYEVEDEMYVEKVLNNLLLKFDYIVVVLQEKMSTEELHGSLILHESRIHERPENSTKKDSTEKVLQALTPKSNEQGQSNNGGGDSHARGRNFRARGRGGYGNYQGCGRGANSIMTPAEEWMRLTKDGNGGVVNSTYFRSLVGSLRGEPIELLGYTDSDWAGDTVERKSTSGYAFFISYGVFS